MSSTEQHQVAVMQCVEEMQKLQQTHPLWWSDYDDAQMDISCDRAVLEELLETAPTPFARGVVFGKIVFRQQIAALTEEAF
jgi:hypothetical protein